MNRELYREPAHTELRFRWRHSVGETISACFDRIVARFAEREALVVRHQGIRWSYRELQRRVNNLAVTLLRLGLNPGERIGIWSQNNAEWLLVQLATAKAGLILVNINPAYRGSELKFALNKVRCRALILSPSFKSSNRESWCRLRCPRFRSSSGWERSGRREC